MNTLEVCLSPDLLNEFDLQGKTAVIVDILRATSCMTAGIGSGVKEIRPLASLDECMRFRSHGFLLAGERNGVMVEGFDIGNSPFEYMERKVLGKRIAVTTTNGTVAIERSAAAREIIIGSFLNLSAVEKTLLNNRQDVVIVCAGWKGKINLEDTLFAGALVERLTDRFKLPCDAALIARSTWLHMKGDLLSHVLKSSHAARLRNLGIEDDIAYCLETDLFECCPKVHEKTILSD